MRGAPRHSTALDLNFRFSRRYGRFRSLWQTPNCRKHNRFQHGGKCKLEVPDVTGIGRLVANSSSDVTAVRGKNEVARSRFFTM